jgi:hypothetical protein
MMDADGATRFAHRGHRRGAELVLEASLYFNPLLGRGETVREYGVLVPSCVPLIGFGIDVLGSARQAAQDAGGSQVNSRRYDLAIS